jgi:hypothetical protein
MAEENSPPLDANSRLKQRIRPTVPPRDTSALRNNYREELETEEECEKLEDTSRIQLPLTTAPETEKLEDTHPSELPLQTSNKSKEKKLVSFTLRVEDSVDKGLKSLCTAENITKETFLEAAYLVCLENETVMQQVLEIALERKLERRSTGIQRRAKAMTRYLQDS